ncbi:MAG: hypothetical protein E7163_03550 [Firmicutes bacterium]|nr:hypothetical protein [Bacillota bacterium]
MAKKQIENFKIDEEELKPVTIGTFESRKKTSIGIFFILSLFVIFIFFLPEISSLINKYLNPISSNIPNPNRPGNIINPSDNNNPSLEERFVPYAENLKINNEDISLTNIRVDVNNSELIYTITNNRKKMDIDELNYYIEIYNNEKTLIERVKLVSNLVLENGAYREITKNITIEAANSIGYIILVKKSTVEYPEVSMQIEDDIGSIVCTKDHEKVTYRFNDYQLTEVISEISYKIEDKDYENILKEQKKLVNSYNNKEGIISTLVEYETGYNIITNVDLKNISDTYIFNADTFKLNTIPKVVSFEMEAQGFDCK